MSEALKVEHGNPVADEPEQQPNTVEVSPSDSTAQALAERALLGRGLPDDAVVDDVALLGLE